MLIGGTCNVDQAVILEVEKDTGDSTVAEIHRLLMRGMREAPRYAGVGAACGRLVRGGRVADCRRDRHHLAVDRPGAGAAEYGLGADRDLPCAFALATPVAAAIGVGPTGGCRHVDRAQ